VFNWFKPKQKIDPASLPRVDIHSHLLPNLDDGVQSFEEAEELIKKFAALGYKKLVTTPHVMSDFYRNTPDDIQTKLKELNAFLTEKNIAIELEAAAEYYLDEDLQEKIETGEPLLTINNKYLLFETNFMTEPLNLKEFIFTATTKGYKLILAHPERYIYLQNNFEKAEDLLNRGVLFQLNISSLSGYYSKSAQQMAFKLIDKGWIHFVGSDCHNLQHMQLLTQTQNHKYFQKALSLPLLNNSLLT
jgi:protein-tyrosine phosphatase